MKICLDENVPNHVKYRLEAEGHNVRFAREICEKGTSDIDLLKACTQECRVILTNDKDFDTLNQNYNHEGVLRYSKNQPTKKGWKKIVTGINLIDKHISMKNILQWPKEWAERFTKE